MPHFRCEGEDQEREARAEEEEHDSNQPKLDHLQEQQEDRRGER